MLMQETQSRKVTESARLEIGPDGQLYHRSDGVRTPCTVTRCFPWTHPDRYFSIRDRESKELMLVERLEVLDPGSRSALEGALQESAFVFDIEKIESIEEEFQLRVWRVLTRQGPRQFQTELEDWPRRLPGGGLLIRDIAGDLFCVRQPRQLDGASQTILWPFIE